MTDSNDELRPEYDMTRFLREGVKGKHVEAFRKGTNVVLLDDDVWRAFPDSESVNEALRLMLRITEITRRSGAVE